MRILPRESSWIGSLALVFTLLGPGLTQSRAALAATCLNGVVEAGEACEGDLSPCLNCQCIDGYAGRGGICVPVCADGVHSPEEACDDGNVFDDDGCDANCTVPTCGNGITNSGEECDDTGLSPSCDADCTLAECGDGVVNRFAGEVCDPPGSNCTDKCQSATCGNGIIDAGSGELCDDENLLDGDGCDSNCTPTGCGNGILTSGESCDDGNTLDGDGCDSNCTATACGNGILTAPEKCEPPNSGDCGATCESAVCGDGVLDPGVGEVCDDGNLIDDDGCDSNCTVTGCGNGRLNAGELCDDGNTDSDDGCSNACLINATCPATPSLTCATPTKSKVSIGASRFLPNKNRIAWVWQASDATASNFGDPRLFGSTSYALCVYEGGALVHQSQAAGQAICSGLDCWAQGSRGGFVYRDVNAARDGVRKLDLRPLPRTSIRWRSKGPGIRPIVPLPLTPTVEVQLINSAGTCWSSTFTSALRSGQTQFEAK